MENKTTKPARSYAARRRTRKVIALSCLALFMALSIGVTWTFWQGTFTPPALADRHVTIVTGQAPTVNSVLTFNDLGFTGNLIPQGIWAGNIAAERENNVEYVLGVTTVHWTGMYLANGAPNPDGAPVPITRTAALDVVLNDELYDMANPLSPMILSEGGTTIDMDTLAFRYRRLAGTGDRYHNEGLTEDTHLFEVELRWSVDAPAGAPTMVEFGSANPIPDGGIPMVGEQRVYIFVYIRMNIPLDEDYYELVSNRNIGFSFTFDLDVDDL